MGCITGPFGIKGWVRLRPFSAAPQNLLAYPVWWIAEDAGWRERRVEAAEMHNAAVAAKLAGCDEREAAARLRGREVAVPRDALPKAAPNEYYWADLAGLKVVNEQGEDLGTVSRVFETGANDVLVVQGARERLIPFTEQVVQRVDLAGGVIRVEWGADY